MKKMTTTLNKTTKQNAITYAIIFACFVFCIIYSGLPSGSSLIKGLFVPICAYVIMALSLNLTVGILGELSLGHAGFMCLGAFVGSTFSMLTQESLTSVWVRFPLAILLGGAVAAVAGILIGIPVLRLKGDYLAIVTLAFGEIIKNIVNNIYLVKDVNGVHFALGVDAYNNMELDDMTAENIINGAMGITGAPRDSNYIVGFVLVLITLIVILNLVQSRAGRAIMAIRDNRIAAESIGINITKYKLIAFSISAMFAGMAGVLYGHNLSSLVAGKFDYNLSILVLVFVVLGGIGSMRGSIIAAIILTALPELLRGSFSDYRMLIYAILLIVMMLVNNNENMAMYKERFKSYLHIGKGGKGSKGGKGGTKAGAEESQEVSA